MGAGAAASRCYGTREKRPMRSADLALLLAAVTAALSVLFVAYALSGADLCAWCGVLD